MHVLHTKAKYMHEKKKLNFIFIRVHPVKYFYKYPKKKIINKMAVDRQLINEKNISNKYILFCVKKVR